MTAAPDGGHAARALLSCQRRGGPAAATNERLFAPTHVFMHCHPRRACAALLLICGLAMASPAGVTPVLAATPKPTPTPTPAPTPTPVVVPASWAAGGTLPALGTGRIWSLATSPSVAAMVVAGTDRGVYVSTDSGAHWTASGLKDSIRVWAVGFDPRTPTHLFAGTDGAGVMLSQDGGVTWSEASNGLGNRTVRTMAFGLDGIAAGTASGVWLSPDGSTWHTGGLAGDSVAALTVAANSPNLVLIAGVDRGPDLTSGYLFRYTGTGVAWQTLQSGLAASAVVSALAAGPLTATVTKRPLLANTSKGTFRSGDGGDTWTMSTGIADTVVLTSAVFSPLDPALVYAGADVGGSAGGELMRSTDGGASFAIADKGLPAKTRQVVSLAVEQVTPPTVIAALDPIGGGVVYSETDTAAPAPPPLVAEAPGAPVPETLATPPPTPRPSRAAPSSPTPAAAGGFSGLVVSAFHWPIPLVFEVLFVLLVVYVGVRWRQRYYVEGPP